MALAGVLTPRGNRLATADAEACTSRAADDPTQGVVGGWFRVRSTASFLGDRSDGFVDSPPPTREALEKSAAA